MNGHRIERLRAQFDQRGVDSFVTTDATHVRYLSGFSGSSGLLLVGKDEAVLVTDFRYEEQASQEAPDVRIEIARDGLIEKLMETQGLIGRRVGFESCWLSHKSYLTFKEKFTTSEWIPQEGMVESLSIIKDKTEIAKIREAVRIGDAVFAKVLRLVRPGISERDLAAEIEYVARRSGAEKTAFEPIVASGPHSSMPHAPVTDRRIEEGDLLTVDMGVVYEGYASDLTRTVVIGTPTAKQRRTYEIVLSAQNAALDEARAGIACAALDKVARGIIENAGHGPEFGHSLGHGVGLRVHELPRLSSKEKRILEPGMVVTIEPGIYIAGWGGVRIEDLVVIREGGCENLTRASKAFELSDNFDRE